MKNVISRLKKAFYNIENFESIFNDKLIISRYNDLSMNTIEIGITPNLRCEYPIIVSLTTYSYRINEVYLTIESLLHQTIKPNRIILWLDRKFENTNIPIQLKNQEKRGLEIRFCMDIRSYTKLVPTIELCPDSIIVTVDDDIIYTPDFIEHLINHYMDDPTKVYFYRGHKIAYDKNGNLTPYSKWVKTGASGSSLFNLPTGVGGVLYPPYCFHKEVLNKDIFLDICPYADDIWFKAMTLLNGIECQKIETGKEADEKFVYINTAVSTSLSNINNLKGMNDVQAKKVFEKYNIRKRLNEGIV